MQMNLTHAVGNVDDIQDNWGKWEKPRVVWDHELKPELVVRTEIRWVASLVIRHENYLLLVWLFLSLLRLFLRPNFKTDYNLVGV